MTNTPAQPEAPRRSRRLTRRAFLRLCGGSVLAGAGTVAYAHFVEPHWPVVEQLEMDLPDLAPPFAGLRLVQLSDLHLSECVSAEYLATQLDRAMELRPDLIALTGDYITRGDPRYIRTLVELLSRLQAPLGVFAVLGNHDFGLFSSVRRRPAQPYNYLQDPLESAGVRVLRNESVRVERGVAALQLVGLDDYWSFLFNPAVAFAGVDPAVPCVALMHNPDPMDTLYERPCQWVLAGHTHGGQVRIPLYGALRVPIENAHLDQGLFRFGGQRLYVNRGIGHVLPLRFNCRPEITLFTLRPRG